MKPSISAGPPSGLLLVLMCCPLLGLVQTASSKKPSENGHPHLGDSDPERCMRHHFVETITHPIYKCNSKLGLGFGRGGLPVGLLSARGHREERGMKTER
ncbi:unnamed protein product [Pleuronectes platessa]|uniref:Uncharacterized protein n=1 Tax=Pleuronectes platessa TaxID=8262 RepID=A0A9N7YCC5_PLEPL|nr:unnamed protein product [Pleuronectes platessa]